MLSMLLPLFFEVGEGRWSGTKGAKCFLPRNALLQKSRKSAPERCSVSLALMMYSNLQANKLGQSPGLATYGSDDSDVDETTEAGPSTLPLRTLPAKVSSPFEGPFSHLARTSERRKPLFSPLPFPPVRSLKLSTQLQLASSLSFSLLRAFSGAKLTLTRWKIGTTVSESPSINRLKGSAPPSTSSRNHSPLSGVKLPASPSLSRGTTPATSTVKEGKRREASASPPPYAAATPSGNEGESKNGNSHNGNEGGDSATVPGVQLDSLAEFGIPPMVTGPCNPSVEVRHVSYFQNSRRKRPTDSAPVARSLCRPNLPTFIT